MSQTNLTAGERSGREKAAPSPETAARRRARLRPVLMIGGIVLVALASLLYWLFGGRYVYTDDAYVNAAKVSLSTDVTGLVNQIYVQDNQYVAAGQKLFDLGQKSFAISVEAARAQLAQTVQDINAAKHGYQMAQAQIAAQQAQVESDKSNLARYAAVVKTGGATRAQYDDARFALQGDEAKLKQMQAVAGQQLAKLSGQPDIDPTKTPQYLAALANLNQALLNQQHSVVYAPYSGTVTHVEKLQPGMLLPAGTAAFGLVSNKDVYITAQPKENQMTWVRQGQSVNITVDAYPGKHWKGEVQSISPATGSQFSILPAQNSSGNWVKVVQRIPVRIKILSGPKDMTLRAGMSVEISIDTNHHRHLSDLF
ncbi:HlyD family secretion protein [Acidocella aminolytica]|jgi:membrane fusion protein (multidrug efflux system)|uniref:Multidrug resistance efflux pump HlyD n=1 Tax=Acidocella aminolytica 101 = DSM 11237 TaxID=1120923 RepID=A0A0D6PAM8_9PROT|nr:HlyD family secretion protein [Acidocella aminolytica]GAN78805.1 multidrug resistance efflux pump HlyD [Acidocella aminolytica 101 = DSM 11237]GBQ44032.1 multidrug resistance efflux pump [Acidocella aminolytica 101 = DSM 11237]SHE86913.1 membrane fusion protein, multidrug efflux system [Acidocella aminolytica 101 = DSM 11237]